MYNLYVCKPNYIKENNTTIKQYEEHLFEPISKSILNDSDKILSYFNQDKSFMIIKYNKSSKILIKYSKSNNLVHREVIMYNTKNFQDNVKNINKVNKKYYDKNNKINERNTNIINYINKIIKGV